MESCVKTSKFVFVNTNQSILLTHKHKLLCVKIKKKKTNKIWMIYLLIIV